MQNQFITIKELYRNKEEYIGKTVKLAGWIRTSRASKNFGFVELNDGSFFKNMQIVLSDEKLENFKVPPVIALTANLVTGLREKYISEGFDDYLSKPMDTKDLNKLLVKYFKDRKE